VKSIPRSSSFIVAALAAGFTAGPLAAGETKHDMKIIMALAGVPVGKLAVSLRLANQQYTMSGSARTFGVSRLFSKAKGYAKSNGKLVGDHIIALSHSVQYRSGKKNGSVDIQFNQGEVVDTKSVPAVHYKSDAVKVTAADLKSVLDPMSISIIAVNKEDIGNPNAICNRTLPIYDGKNRFDLKMRYKGRRQVVTKGFKGLVFVCSDRYVPVSAHRPHKKHIQQLKNNRSIEISLARIGSTAVYGIIQFSAKTPYGKIVGKPSYFTTTSL
jgi:hypothetical protein